MRPAPGFRGRSRTRRSTGARPREPPADGPSRCRGHVTALYTGDGSNKHATGASLGERMGEFTNGGSGNSAPGGPGSETLPPRKTRRERSNGTPRRTRTPNLLVRSQTLYPIELWARGPLAEREGFEPSVHLRIQLLSRQLPSATRAPLLEKLRIRRATLAEGEGLEPPRACARRFSRPLPYQLGLALRSLRQYSNAPRGCQTDSPRAPRR